MLRQGLLLLALAGIGFGGGDWDLATPPPQKQAAIAAGKIGSRLPDFSVKDLQGQYISSDGIRGKVVLIDFWATWCQPCKKEMPGYQELLNRYGPQGLAVVGLKLNNMKDTEEPIVFARNIAVTYPLAVAEDDLIQKFGGIEGLPTTMLYDRKGILRKKVVGFEHSTAFESALKPLLVQTP